MLSRNTRRHCAAKRSARLCACWVSAGKAEVAPAFSDQHLWNASAPSFSNRVDSSALFGLSFPPCWYALAAASLLAWKSFQIASQAAIAAGLAAALTIAI